MRKFFHITFGILAIITILSTFYFISVGNTQGIGIALFEGLFFTVLHILSGENTDDVTWYKGFGVMLVACILLFIVVATSSCSANKYGCGRGAPKQTWNKMVKRINSPY